jgi:hypothetical protein
MCSPPDAVTSKFLLVRDLEKDHGPGMLFSDASRLGIVDIAKALRAYLEHDLASEDVARRLVRGGPNCRRCVFIDMDACRRSFRSLALIQS